MALVLVLLALIIAMGCGALACRWLIADKGQARYIDAAPLALAGGAGDRSATAPEQPRGQLIYLTKRVPEGYAKLAEPAGVRAP